MCSVSSEPGEKLKPWTVSRAFTDLLSNSPKRSPRFSPAYEGKDNMFYFLIVATLMYQKKTALVF